MDYSKHNAVSNLNDGSNIMTRQELTRRAVMVVLTSPELKNSTKSMILRAYGNCGMDIDNCGNVSIHLNACDVLILTGAFTSLKISDAVNIDEPSIGQEKLANIRQITRDFIDLGSPEINGDIEVILNVNNLPQEVVDYIRNSKLTPVDDDYDGGVMYKVDDVAALLEDSIYDEYADEFIEMDSDTNISYIAI